MFCTKDANHGVEIDRNSVCFACVRARACMRVCASRLAYLHTQYYTHTSLFIVTIIEPFLAVRFCEYFTTSFV